MDIATIIGLVLALIGIVGGLLLEGGELADITQYTAAIIVLGGTFGAVFVQFPMSVCTAGFKQFKYVFVNNSHDPTHVIEQIVEFANKARKEGLVALEPDVKNIEYEFFKKAMLMAIDGASIKDVEESLELELGYMEEYGELPAKFWEGCGGYAPTIGIIGAVMGLIQVMKNLQDINAVGHGIAVAFVATIYGVAFANVLFMPAAGKIKAKHRDEMIVKEMIISGVLLIIEGINPRVIKDKLLNFLDEETKEANKDEAA